MVYKKEVFNEFVEFYALPINERVEVFGCKTQKQFAEKYGVDKSTLSEWTKRKDFNTKIKETISDWGRAETSNVFAGWRNSCIRGNPHAIELWLAYFMGWNKEQVVKHVQEFTKEDLVSLIKVLPKEKQQKFYDTVNAIIESAQKIREQRRSSEESMGEQNEHGDSGHKPPQADNIHEKESAGNEVAEGTKESVRADMEGRQDKVHNESTEGRRKE